MVLLSKILAALPIVYAASSSQASSNSELTTSTGNSEVSSSSSSSSSRSNSKSSSSSSSKSTSTNLSPFPTLHAFSDEGDVYYVNVKVGTPGQSLKLRLDVVQPHLWVPDGNHMGPCSKANESHSICAVGGVFYEQNSDTYHDDLYDASFVSVDGIVINGTMATDNYEFSEVDGGDGLENITLESVDFISGNGSTVAVGALGLGGREPNDALDPNYQTQFLELLKDAHYINSSSYSIYTRDNETAEVIFGGINQDYYQGDLVYFDKIPYSDYGQLKYNYPVVPLSGISVSNQRGNTVFLTTSNETEPVMFDSRLTRSFLPYTMVIQIAMQLNAVFLEELEIWYLRCDIRELGAKLNFQFGNLTIPFPVEEFIKPVDLVFDDGSDACELMIRPNNYFGYSLFGGPFFKQVYLVVDNEGDKVALAHAANPTSSNTQSNSSSTTDFQKSAISSGLIPFAKTNNITESYTLSYLSDRSSMASFQPDVFTASITGNEIFTGRVQSSNSSSLQSSSSSAGAYRLESHPVGNTLYVLICSFLGLVGLGMLM